MNELEEKVGLTEEEHKWNSSQKVDMCQNIITILGERYKNNYKDFNYNDWEMEWEDYTNNHKKVKKNLKNIEEFDKYKYLKPIFEKTFRYFIVSREKKNNSNPEPSSIRNYGINYLVKVLVNRGIMNAYDIIEFKDFLDENYDNDEFYDLKFIAKNCRDREDLIQSINKYYTRKYS